jgi:hypothetical protein
VLAVALGPFTTGILDPYRALVASIITTTFGVECWIFYVGPVVGAIAAGIVAWILGLNRICAQKKQKYVMVSSTQ